MKKKYLLVVFFAVFMLGGLYAQPGHGADDNEMPHASISGIAALLVGGAAYGLKKTYSNKN